MNCPHCGGQLYSNLKVGVLLIGGSLKGIYGHTGVMSAIVEMRNHGIVPSVICGASAGSVIASFYATGMSMWSMEKKILLLKSKDFVDLISKKELFYELIFNRGKGLLGFLKGDKLEKYIQESLKGVDDFSKTTIPLYVAATNLNTYELTLFNTGSISEKVRASTSIPMLFCPQKIDKSNYIDGAVIKRKLPEAILNVHPELDLLIVSNFSHEPTIVDENYLENSTLPMLEITRRVLSMNETKDWPKQIGNTKIIYIKPKVNVVVDFFNINSEAGREVFRRAKIFAKQTLLEGLKNDLPHS